MSDRPVTILAPTLQAVLSSTCKRLRRPEGSLSQCQPGDRLWVREKFRLPAAVESISPLQALERGATPVFLADEPDLPDFALKDLSRIRFARELPRAWHRAHLVIRTIERVPLQAMTQIEAQAAGFASKPQFIAAWNAGVSFPGRRSGASFKWDANPTVLLICFDCIASPIPEQDQLTGVADARA